MTDFLYPTSASDIHSHKDGSLVTVTDDATPIRSNLCIIMQLLDSIVLLVPRNLIDPSGDGVFWKVKLEKIPRNWIFLGIAETLDLQNDIYADNKTYGWIEHATYVKGRKTGHSRTDGISDFNQGESLYFSLKSNKLQIGPLLAIVIVIIFVVVSLFSMVFFYGTNHGRF